MAAAENPVESQTQADGRNLVLAGLYPNRRLGFEHSIVVLAMGRPCWLHESDDGCGLWVETEDLKTVREELARFDRESVNWPPRPAIDESPRRAGPLVPMLWCLVILGVFRLQQTEAGLTESGFLDGQAVFDRGEIWRAFTALFLHADLGHLVANAISGIFVFWAVLATLGHARGGALLAAAAIAGNIAVAALHHPLPYHSLGASTAIFAGLGLLTGRAVRAAGHAHHPHPRRAMMVPLAAGLAVLGIYGAGGGRIDVGAHLAGFGAGLVLGFAAGNRRKTEPGRPHAKFWRRRPKGHSAAEAQPKLGRSKGPQKGAKSRDRD